MSAAGFLQGLQTFDKDTITEEMVELLAPYLTMEDYTFEGAKKVSFDAIFVCTNKADAFIFTQNDKVSLPRCKMPILDPGLSYVILSVCLSLNISETVH